MLSRLARKVNRLLPTAVTGDWPVASVVWLAEMNGVWRLIMFWQYMAGLLVWVFWLLTGAWPTSSRYRLVLAVLTLPLPSSPISSFSGTSASRFGVFFSDSSSSIACEEVGWPLLARSGAWNGVQPSTGSMNRSSRVLSLPFSSSVEPGTLAAFDVVSCAVCPVAGLSRYSVVTLSDGSWSTMSKLRVVGQSLPVPSFPSVATILLDVPSDGTFSLPSDSSR